MSRTAPPKGQDLTAEREAFDRAVAPYYRELLQAAQREVRHRLTLGQFEPDDPTPEQLLDRALERAWRERTRLSPALGIKAWALASIFRMGEVMAERKDDRRRKTNELLPEEVEPDPLYEESDEDFWQSHELDYPKTERVFSGTVDRLREDAASDDELVGLLDPREREVLLMHEVHGVALPEVASARWDPADRSGAAPRERTQPPAAPRTRRRTDPAASLNKDKRVMPLRVALSHAYY